MSPTFGNQWPLCGATYMDHCDLSVRWFIKVKFNNHKESRNDPIGGTLRETLSNEARGQFYLYGGPVASDGPHVARAQLVAGVVPHHPAVAVAAEAEAVAVGAGLGLHHRPQVVRGAGARPVCTSHRDDRSSGSRRGGAGGCADVCLQPARGV